MMYSSVYSILVPKIEAEATGTLSVDHVDGKSAEIYLSDGTIVGCQNGQLSGEPAAQMVAKWVAFDHEFHEGEIPSEPRGTDLDEKAWIKLLEKTDRVVSEVNGLACNDRVRLIMHTFDFEGEISVNTDDLKIMTLLNGERTIEQVQREAGLSEYEILYMIYRYHCLGLIKPVGYPDTMDDYERDLVLGSIDEKLSDILGPAAMIIAKESLIAIGADKASMSWQDVGKLTDTIAECLDDSEKEAFLGWWRNTPTSEKAISYCQ